MKIKSKIGNHGGQMDEGSIVWIEDPTKYKYLREHYESCASRVRWAKKNFHKPGKLIGYATLVDDAPSITNGVFHRRFWWIKTGVDPYETGGGPGEAVIPESVCAGKDSKSGWKE